MKTATIQELNEALLSDTPLIDVRESYEYTAGFVPTAKNIPLSQLTERFSEIKNGSYIICQSGARSEHACDFLEAKGLDVTNVLGGTSAWTGCLATEE
ncbi:MULTISPECIES: rhodanese-like domain-containing protein [Lactococcus]|uniref:Rhodanese-like domain-containing protein n=1 Tax=Lactococcus muris TaxID=2941330 RepID=A0ABV4D7X2_9LACT|nr:rhodanese-like domain-containing protein [Lactococcus ileimucosae]